jgi:hypothetical protein
MSEMGFDEGAKAAGNPLREEHLFTRGLKERELGRLKMPMPRSEPPMTEHHAILSNSAMPFGRVVRNSFKLLVGARRGTLPPKMLYRLSSLGESYAEKQKSDPVVLAKPSRGGELIVVAPKEKREQLQQVLLVDKTTRIELEAGQKISEQEWSFRLRYWQIPFNARVVLIYTEGTKWQLALRGIKSAEKKIYK